MGHFDLAATKTTGRTPGAKAGTGPDLGPFLAGTRLTCKLVCVSRDVAASMQLDVARATDTAAALLEYVSLDRHARVKSAASAISAS